MEDVVQTRPKRDDRGEGRLRQPRQEDRRPVDVTLLRRMDRVGQHYWGDGAAELFEGRGDVQERDARVAGQTLADERIRLVDLDAIRVERIICAGRGSQHQDL